MSIKKLIFFVLIVAGVCSAQSAVRWDEGGPIAGLSTISTGPIPYLIALTDGVQLNWCQYPANSVQGSACTNFATTFTDTTLATACPSTQPIVLQNSNVCRSTSDSLGNLGVYTSAGTYSYTLTDGSITYGPFVVTLGGSGGSGGATVKINGATQGTTNFNGSNPTADTGFTAATLKTDSINTIIEVPTLPLSEMCLTGSGLGSQLNIGFQGTINPCTNPAMTIIQQANGGMELFGPITLPGLVSANNIDIAQNINNEVLNCSINPTVQGQLGKFNGGCSVITTTSDTTGILGIVTVSGGASNGATIATSGNASCVFDGATTAQDWVVNSTTVGGDCHDSGVATSSAAPVATVGIIPTTHASAGTYSVYVALGSGGGISGVVPNQGLAVSGTQLELIQTCTSGQILSWNGTNWVCAATTGTGNTTSTAGTNNQLAKFNGANSIINSLASDNGSLFSYIGTSGAQFNSGGASTILGISDSSTNCPTVGLVSGTSYWCSGSFLPLWITDNAGTITTTQAEILSDKGIASGYAGLDGTVNVPGVNLQNFPAAVSILSSGNISQSISPTGVIYTVGDYGASPDTTIVGVTDNATSATDFSTNLFADTGAASVHCSFAARIRGIQQLQICEQPGPQGQIIIGSAVVPTSINNTPYAKTIIMSNTAGHSEVRVYQNSTSDTGVMQAMNNATAAGTGWFYFKGCAGATGSDTGCGSGTTNWSINGNGLGVFNGLTGTAAVDFSGSTISKLRVGAALTTSVNGDSGYDTTNKMWHAWQNGVDAYQFGGPVSGTYTNGHCTSFVNTAGVITLADAGVCGTTTPLWTNLQPGSGNLSIAPGGTSIFTTTTAVSQFFAFKNTTAALVGASQSSPNFALCGTEWHSAASVEGCVNLQFVPGTGLDAANTINVTHTGSATGITTFQTPGPLASGSDGVHAAAVSLLGNTTNPAVAANTVGFMGPSSASFTAYSLQFPSTNPATATPLLSCVTPVSGVSTCTWVANSGGSGSPGGSTTQLQYNNAGAFGGVSGWTTNGTTTMTAGATSVLDLSAMAPTAGLKLPSVAGAVPTADGFIGINTTNHTLTYGINGTTGVSAIAATGTNSATTCSNQFVSAVSGVAIPTCTTVTLAGAQFANQGTTTTVLHGNAAGNPSFGSIVAGDITASTITGSQIASSIALAGSPTTTTQTAKDNSTKIATTAYVDAPVPLTTGTSVTLSAPRQFFICTTTCTITVPVPAAGMEFCVRNNNNISSVITFAAIGSSARYENTAFTAYGTAGTGTLVSGGAAGDKMCLLGLDSTHYLVASFNGTWTAN